MKKSLIVLMALSFLTPLGFARVTNKHDEYYSTGLCKKPGYHCVTVKRGQSWRKLFPNPTQMDIVQRVNRTNMRLWRGRKIAVPDDLSKITLLDVAPFPRKIQPMESKLIIVNQDKLAWGAYAANGHLLKWGAISSGKNYCRDIRRGCRTQTGIFYMFNKKDRACRSGIFPVGRGGAKMPYCMFFYKGFALHGSHEVPGYRASHGCVRLFTRDAKWLNKSFVNLKQPAGAKGTKIVIQEITGDTYGKSKKRRRR